MQSKHKMWDDFWQEKHKIWEKGNVSPYRVSDKLEFVAQSYDGV